jgi:hypothetical protein
MFKNNFFLSKEERNLIFILRKLNRLNNSLSKTDRSYYDMVDEMSNYYQKILDEMKVVDYDNSTSSTYVNNVCKK